MDAIGSGVAQGITYKEHYLRNTVSGGDFECVLVPYTSEDIINTDSDAVIDIAMVSAVQRFPVAFLVLGKLPGAFLNPRYSFITV